MRTSIPISLTCDCGRTETTLGYVNGTLAGQYTLNDKKSFVVSDTSLEVQLPKGWDAWIDDDKKSFHHQCPDCQAKKNKGDPTP